MRSLPRVEPKAELAGRRCLNFLTKPRQTRSVERSVERLTDAAVVPHALTGWRLSVSAWRRSLSMSSLRVIGKSSSVRVLYLSWMLATCTGDRSKILAVVKGKRIGRGTSAWMEMESPVWSSKPATWAVQPGTTLSSSVPLT